MWVGAVGLVIRNVLLLYIPCPSYERQFSIGVSLFGAYAMRSRFGDRPKEGMKR